MADIRLRAFLVLAAMALTSKVILAAATLPPAVAVEGTIDHGDNVSAVVATDRFLIVGADEGAALQVLTWTDHGLKVVKPPIALPANGEADIEGMAIRKPAENGRFTVFAIGCHCKNRDKVDEEKKLQKNRERLATVKEETSRANVFRLTVDAETGAVIGNPEHVSLAPILKAIPILQRFTEIPSKENGIDIEGLVAGPDGKLYAGFRGPVLRGNFVPVLVFDFDHPDKADLRFVNLGGLGIRDITAVSGGFLILAGPVGDGRPDYRIFFWDGADEIPGKDRPGKTGPEELTEVPLPTSDAKAEGLAVLEEHDKKYDVLLVFDGPDDGRPTRFTVTRKP